MPLSVKSQSQILHIRWLDHVSNVEVTARIELPSITDTMASLIPVQSCGSCEQQYSCLWCLGLHLNPSRQNPPSTQLEDTTWSPFSTVWGRLRVRHSVHPTSCDSLQVAATEWDRRYGPPVSMRSEERLQDTFEPSCLCEKLISRQAHCLSQYKLSDRSCNLNPDPLTLLALLLIHDRHNASIVRVKNTSALILGFCCCLQWL